MFNVSEVIEKLKQNLKKILKIRSPSEESVVDMDSFNKRIEEAMRNITKKEG